MSYTYLEHTADLKIQGLGFSLENALESIAEGMLDFLVARNRIKDNRQCSIILKENTLDNLVIAFFEELLFLHEVENIIFSHVVIEFLDTDEMTLKATAFGDDVSKHIIQTEIKAVTYAQLKIVHIDNKWQVEIVFDI